MNSGKVPRKPSRPTIFIQKGAIPWPRLEQRPRIWVPQERLSRISDQILSMSQLGMASHHRLGSDFSLASQSQSVTTTLGFGPFLQEPVMFGYAMEVSAFTWFRLHNVSSSQKTDNTTRKHSFKSRRPELFCSMWHVVRRTIRLGSGTPSRPRMIHLGRH